MPVDPIEFSKQLHEDRMKRALPTRDSIVVPNLSLHQRAKAAGDARVREHRAQEFRDWFARARGRAATDAEVTEYLDGGDAA